MHQIDYTYIKLAVSLKLHLPEKLQNTQKILWYTFCLKLIFKGCRMKNGIFLIKEPFSKINKGDKKCAKAL